ncbi:MAG TPA: peptidoglycan DD-metalloendopeptidase family protein [Candidatus Paceibacterota bacterium]|nr:peptidoglycan DD-metalloendopeptidase family protein [Candidatus Paceibacterota bacterium]
MAYAQDTALEATGFSYQAVVQNDAASGIADTDNEIITSGGALMATVANIGSLEGVDDGEALSDQIEVYVIRKGDSIGQIAEMFGVSANTILWANNMKKGDKLVEGETLVILPVDGLKHTVVKGDTLRNIAAKYKADVLDIAGYNGMSIEDQLTVGQELIIPNADVDLPSTSSSSSKGKTSTKTTVSSGKTVSGYFINPVPNYRRRSQGYHGKNAIDLAAPIGTKIVASAPGTVLVARNGYNGGYGNMVIIQHPNGTKTLYGHMSKLGTHTGAKVSRGEVIGYVGSTGHSTGPHLHFEIYGAKNPGTTTPMSWAKLAN